MTNNLKSSKFEKILIQNGNNEGEVAIGKFTLITDPNNANTLNIKTSKQTYFSINNESGQLVFNAPVIFNEKITALDQLTFKGEKGDVGPQGPQGPQGVPGDASDAILPDWVVEWGGNYVEIGPNYLISPKIFTGRNIDGFITGLFLGENPLEGSVGYDNLLNKNGLMAVKDNEITVFIDAETGDATFKGEIEATSGQIGPFKVLKKNNEYYLEFASDDTNSKFDKMRFSSKGIEIGLNNDDTPKIFLSKDGNATFSGKVDFTDKAETTINGISLSKEQLIRIEKLSSLFRIITGDNNIYALDQLEQTVLNDMIKNPSKYGGVFIQFPFEISESGIIK